MFLDYGFGTHILIVLGGKEVLESLLKIAIIH